MVAAVVTLSSSELSEAWCSPQGLCCGPCLAAAPDLQGSLSERWGHASRLSVSLCSWALMD